MAHKTLVWQRRWTFDIQLHVQNRVLTASLVTVRRGRAAECLYDAHAAETRSQAWKRRYDTADESNSIYRDFFDALRCRPSEEVTDIVGRRRAGARIEDLLRHVQTGDLLLQ